MAKNFKFMPMVQSFTKVVCSFFDKDYGLMMVKSNGSRFNADNMIYGIMCGHYEIVKLRWEPKEGDKYYSISLPTKSICLEIWHNETSDYALKTLGMIYRSAEEAEANLSKDYERLTGEPWSSR